MRIHLVLLAVVLGGGWVARGQIVDTGSQTGVAGKDNPGAKAAEPPAVSSPEEERSRNLLQLKAERASGRFSKGGPQLAEIDEQITALQQQIAAQGRGVFSDVQEVSAVEVVYPRIVQPEYAEAGAHVAAPPAASSAVPAGPLTPSTSDSDSTTAARQALQQSVSVAADQTQLRAVFEQLAGQAHANLYVNWTALQTAGIDKATSVTLSLANISCTRALRAMLDQVGGAGAGLGYTIDDGVIVISTREDLSSAKYQTVRVYNIRDLLAIDAAYPAQLAAQLYESHISNLMDVVKGSVAPDSWRDNGGSIGSIRELNGLLIVNQTADNHAALEQFLAKIRAAR